jgi:hypothetical protein
MDAYIVIGNKNTRKSSLIRSLTGCFNRSVRDIRIVRKDLQFRIYARVGALQETRTTPAAFVDEVARARCEAVLFCLLPAQSPLGPDGFPDAHAYLAHFTAAGWETQSIAVLGQNPGGIRSPKMRQFAQASTDPINVTAQQVRAHFGWR